MKEQHKVGKLHLRNGLELVIDLNDTEDGWLKSKIMSSKSRLEKPLLYENKNTGNISETGETVNFKPEAVDAWIVEEMEVRVKEDE